MEELNMEKKKPRSGYLPNLFKDLEKLVERAEDEEKAKSLSEEHKPGDSLFNRARATG